MMFKARTALLLTIPALAFAGCGSDSKSNSDEDQITSIVNEVGDDPLAICDHLAADLTRMFGDKAGCIRAGKDSGERAGDVKMRDLKVDGDTASVNVTDERGTQLVRFVKEDGDWKITE